MGDILQLILYNKFLNTCRIYHVDQGFNFVEFNF